MKKLVRRALADADIFAALDYYLVNAPEHVAEFIDDVEYAFQHILLYPNSGSLRYAHVLGLPSLRVWSCNKYPYLVFYVELENHIEVWRILHSMRDIPATLQGDV